MSDTISDEVKDFLDGVRDLGPINMFAAASQLETEFGFSKQEAKEALLQWMEGYGRD